MDIETQIINLLKQRGPLSRGEICAATGLVWTSAYRILEGIEKSNKIARFPFAAEHSGRPPTYWALLNNAGELVLKPHGG